MFDNVEDEKKKKKTYKTISKKFKVTSGSCSVMFLNTHWIIVLFWSSVETVEYELEKKKKHVLTYHVK